MQKVLTEAYNKADLKVIFIWKNEFYENPDKIIDEIRKMIL